jgi:biofilm PGA synthesis N-glycosyltransferase PgaC
MEPDGHRLLVISPVHNEGDNLERTARSVASQTLAPDRWVVVDDGSSDETLAIARKLERDIDFMTVLECSQDEAPGVDNLALAREARAFNIGLEHAGRQGYRFIGKLDGDVELPRDWFAKLIARFEDDSSLGLAGGRLEERNGDGWKVIPIPSHHVHGAVKLFRRECLEAIGGIPERLGWDTIDETYARMRGFETKSYPDLIGRHNRAWGSADGRLRGRLWVFLRSFKVARVSPIVLSGLAFFFGYLRAAVRRVPRVDDREFRRFVRGELRARMLRPFRSVLGGSPRVETSSPSGR